MYASRRDFVESFTETGLSLGGAIAACISWDLNHSIMWAFLHGLCSWFYVIYYAIAY